jgi:DNA-binding XRE family transcriptional regulator
MRTSVKGSGGGSQANIPDHEETAPCASAERATQRVVNPNLELAFSLRLRNACATLVPMASTNLAETVLSECAPERVADAAEELAQTALSEIESSVPEALGGERAQVRVYVDAYRQLASQMLDAVGKARPDLIVFDEAHNAVVLVESKAGSIKGDGSVRWLKAALDQEAMSAPFSEWVGTLGVGRGTAVAFVAQLRSMLGDTGPLTIPREHHLPAWTLSDDEAIRFYRAVGDELARVRIPLDRVASVLGVSRTELARLFGVRRQAIEQWEARGVPGERQEKLATLDAIVDLLTAKLKTRPHPSRRAAFCASLRRPVDPRGHHGRQRGGRAR